MCHVLIASRKVTFRGPVDVRREHDQCIRRESPLNGLDVRHRQQFDVPSLPPRFSPGPGTQGVVLDSIEPTEYEEDASLAWPEVEADEARERITQDVANNINDSKVIHSQSCAAFISEIAPTND